MANKSLVSCETQPDTAGGTQARYRLSETVRAFAAECLAASGEHDALRAAHAGWYTALAERAVPELRGARQARWLAQLDAESDNLRAALAWARDAGRHDLGLRLAAALWRYWYVRGLLREGRGWLDAFLDAADEHSVASPALQATALQGAASLAEAAGAYERAIALARRGGALYRASGDLAGEATALNNLGNVAREQGDLPAAARWFEESLSIARAAGESHGVASAVNNLSAVRRRQGALEEADALARQSLALRRAQDDRGGMAIALDNLAAIALARGDLAGARVHCQEALALWREVEDSWGLATGLAELSAIALQAGEHDDAEGWAIASLSRWETLEDGRNAARLRNRLGTLARLRGDPDLAGTLHRESLRAAVQFGDRYGQLLCLEELAAVAAIADPARAALLFGAAAARRLALGIPLSPSEGPAREQILRQLRARLGDEPYTMAAARGEALTADQVLEVALSS